MAISVSTWDQFVAAYQSNDDGVIELLADIDANDNQLTTSITRPRAKTINGNGHAIYNVSTDAVVNSPLFRSTANALTINNCKLYNWYRIENQPFFWSSDTYHAVFNDCEIVMKCTQPLAERTDISRCSLTWSGIKDNSVGHTCRAYNSWLKIDGVLTTTNASKSLWGTLDNSYIEGTINHATLSTFSFKMCNDLTSAVINITTNASNATSFPSSGLTSVFNATKAPNFVAAGNTLSVTDAQLKDAQYLYDAGFNIVI